jgi:hypothetical protein
VLSSVSFKATLNVVVDDQQTLDEPKDLTGWCECSKALACT